MAYPENVIIGINYPHLTGKLHSPAMKTHVKGFDIRRLLRYIISSISWRE
jgi:hypothetical protein